MTSEQVDSPAKTRWALSQVILPGFLLLPPTQNVWRPGRRSGCRQDEPDLSPQEARTIGLWEQARADGVS